MIAGKSCRRCRRELGTGYRSFTLRSYPGDARLSYAASDPAGRYCYGCAVDEAADRNRAGRA
jgi:hypothetical protein